MRALVGILEKKKEIDLTATMSSKDNEPAKDANNQKETTAVPTPSDESKKYTSKSMLEAIEDDDDFEEFEPSNWSKAETEDETQQWMENWDDDMDDDFTKNLRAELLKEGTTSSTTTK